MSSITKCNKAWILAASIGAVQALKDQGFCKWNYAFRSINCNAKNDAMRSISEANNKLNSINHQSDSAAFGSVVKCANTRTKESEESLRKVMYLGCWVPN